MGAATVENYPHRISGPISPSLLAIRFQSDPLCGSLFDSRYPLSLKTPLIDTIIASPLRYGFGTFLKGIPSNYHEIWGLEMKIPGCVMCKAQYKKCLYLP